MCSLQRFDLLLFCIVHNYRLALIFPLWSYIYIYISVYNCCQGQVERQAFVPKALSLCNNVQSISGLCSLVIRSGGGLVGCQDRLFVPKDASPARVRAALVGTALVVPLTVFSQLRALSSKRKWTLCLTSTETITLTRDGEREVVYLSLHCHHQNDSCMKMGSDESHFNVSLIILWETKSQGSVSK